MVSTEHLADAQELHWLAATIMMTALFWMPYVVNRILEHGLWPALQNPAPDASPRTDWAKRMMAAHANAVENLVLFAPLVLVAVLMKGSTPIVVAAAQVYFVARLAHFIIYTLGIPLLRTLAFATGWGACMVIGLSTLGLI